MKLVQELIRHILPGVVRPLRVLWNEVIGFVFLALATLIGFSTWRRADQFSGDARGLFFLIGGFGFVIMLAWFGISSFLRARKISRS